MTHLGFVSGDEMFAGTLTVNIALWILYLIVHIAFALGVSTHVRGRETILVGRGIWVLATLLGGPLVAVGYWLIHASTLAPGRVSDSEPPGNALAPGVKPDLRTVPAFECPNCNVVATQVTADGACLECGAIVKRFV